MHPYVYLLLQTEFLSLLRVMPLGRNVVDYVQHPVLALPGHLVQRGRCASERGRGGGGEGWGIWRGNVNFAT